MKRLRVLDGNLLYAIGALIFFSIGLFLHIENEKLALLVIQIFVVLLPPIIYLKIKGLSLKETLRLKKLRIKHGLLISIITLLLYPVAMIGNLLLLILLSLFGELNPPSIPTPDNVTEYFFLLIIVSLVAGICEEIFFRGFMLSAYEKIGKNKAIIITAILFGIFHFNLYNLFGPIVLGLVFGYLVFLTKSIFAGIVGHMVNNGFAMSIAFIINLLSNEVPGLDVATTEPDISITIALLIALVFLIILSVVTGFIAYLLIEIIRRDIKNEKAIEEENETLIEENNEETKKTKAWEYLPLGIILPMFLFISIIQIKQILGML